MIPTERGDASTDLQKRFVSVLDGLQGRFVGPDALFDVLRLEVLDWRLDHGVDADSLTGATGDPEKEGAAPPQGATS